MVLARAPTLALTPARALAMTLAMTLAHVPTLAWMPARALAMTPTLALSLTLALAMALAMTLALALTLTLTLTLALHLSVATCHGTWVLWTAMVQRPSQTDSLCPCNAPCCPELALAVSHVCYVCSLL
jgi:hypothetical protein